MSESTAAPAAPVAPSTPAAPAAPAESETIAQNTGTQATPAPSEGEKPEVVTPELAAKREGRRFERKLSAALRREAEARARYDVLEQELNKYRQSHQGESDPGEPKLENFKSIEEYGAAVKKYASESALKGHTEKQRQDAQKHELASLERSWNEKAESGAEKYPDWDAVVGDVKPNAPWAIAAMEAENAADVMYHLGKDDAAEAKRIAALPPRAQIREIGKIEAKLLAEPAKPRTPSKAPAPITPLTGTTPAQAGPSEQDDTATWIKKRSKQVHGARR